MKEKLVKLITFVPSNELRSSATMEEMTIFDSLVFKTFWNFIDDVSG
jgi:hypothetical protein